MRGRRGQRLNLTGRAVALQPVQSCEGHPFRVAPLLSGLKGRSYTALAERLQIALELSEVESFRRLARREHLRRQDGPGLVAVLLIELRRLPLDAPPGDAFQRLPECDERHVMSSLRL